MGQCVLVSRRRWKGVSAMSDTPIRYGLLRIERSPLYMRVRIIGERFVYGHVRYLIEPCDGMGQHWVNADRVRVED